MEQFDLTADHIAKIFHMIAVEGIHVPDAITIRCGDIERAKAAILKTTGWPQHEAKHHPAPSISYKGIPVVADEGVLPGEMLVVDRWGKVWARYTV